MKVSIWWVVAVAAVAWWWRKQRNGYVLQLAAQHAADVAAGTTSSAIPIALPKGPAIAVIPGASLRPDEPVVGV